MKKFENILRNYTRKCADQDEEVQYLIKKCMEEVPGLTVEQAREAICVFFETAVDFTLDNDEDEIEIITDSTNEFIFELLDDDDDDDDEIEIVTDSTNEFIFELLDDDDDE